jgi:hypothetical protein
MGGFRPGGERDGLVGSGTVWWGAGRGYPRVVAASVVGIARYFWECA